MCRNIKVLFNFDPPATNSQIRDASLQYVRKLSGFNNPSQQNKEVFDMAVEKIAQDTKYLLDMLTTTSKKRSQDVEDAKTKARNIKRFGIK